MNMAQRDKKAKERARLESAKADVRNRNQLFDKEFDKIESIEQAQELLKKLSKPVQVGQSTQPLVEVTVEGSKKCRENIAKVKERINDLQQAAETLKHQEEPESKESSTPKAQDTKKMDMEALQKAEQQQAETLKHQEQQGSEEQKKLETFIKKMGEEIESSFQLFTSSIKKINVGREFEAQRDALIKQLNALKDQFLSKRDYSLPTVQKFLHDIAKTLLKADMPKENNHLINKILDAGLWLINQCIKVIQAVSSALGKKGPEPFTLFGQNNAAAREFEAIKAQYCKEAGISAEQRAAIEQQEELDVDKLPEQDHDLIHNTGPQH